MDDERTIAEQVAAETAETVDEKDISQAEERVGEDVDVDDEAVRDEIRDEDEARDDRLDQILDRIDAIGRHLDERIDGLSRLMLDGGAVISDAAGADEVVDIEYRPIEEMDLSV